jgi:hypothetical protein
MAAIRNFYADPAVEVSVSQFTTGLITRRILNSLLTPPWPVQQLPTTLRTDIFHLTGTFLAESAFIRTDHRHAIRLKRLVAFFALLFHLQGHATP